MQTFASFTHHRRRNRKARRRRRRRWDVKPDEQKSIILARQNSVIIINLLYTIGHIITVAAGRGIFSGRFFTLFPPRPTVDVSHNRAKRITDLINSPLCGVREQLKQH